MTHIPDFSEAQYSVAQALINKRYGESIEIRLADSETDFDSNEAQPSSCPVLLWTAKGCNFMVLREGEEQFRARYFYTPHEQFSTTQHSFNTVEDCVSGVMQSQADHERERQSANEQTIDVGLKISMNKPNTVIGN